MWGKEKQEKLSKSFQNGVTVLVFVLLAVQFAFFAVKAVQGFRRSGEQRQELAVAADTFGRNGVEKLEGGSGKGWIASAEPRNDGGAEGGSGKGWIASAEPRNDGGAEGGSGKGWIASAEPRNDGGAEPRNDGSAEPRDDGWKWDVVELNSADSAALVSLPGIGPYYAGRILLYREKLFGSFAEPEQLMEIRGIDSALMARLMPRVRIDTSLVRHIDLNTLSPDSLSAHPYIGPYAAKGIDRFRKLLPDGSPLTLDTLVTLKVLTVNQAKRLKRYLK